MAVMFDPPDPLQNATGHTARLIEINIDNGAKKVTPERLSGIRGIEHKGGGLRANMPWYAGYRLWRCNAHSCRETAVAIAAPVATASVVDPIARSRTAYFAFASTSPNRFASAAAPPLATVLARSERCTANWLTPSATTSTMRQPPLSRIW